MSVSPNTNQFQISRLPSMSSKSVNCLLDFLVQKMLSLAKEMIQSKFKHF